MNKGFQNANCMAHCSEMVPNHQLPDMSRFRGGGAEIQATVHGRSRLGLEKLSSFFQTDSPYRSKKKPLILPVGRV